MAAARYTIEELRRFAEEVLRDGFCVLPNHFPQQVLTRWRAEFQPLLERHIECEGDKKNRGAERYYVTLPFIMPFANPAIFEDPDILAVCEQLVGEDMVMCQLATDTPLLGSEYQEIHRDARALFPEAGIETPSFQLAVNFPLVDVTLENGPFEVVRGTHMITREEGMKRLENKEAELEPIYLKLGDVMIRDVRGLHRGTPNKSQEPRPMVVIGYSRRWLFRPEVNIRIPRETYEQLSEKARFLLRYNPVVDSLEDDSQGEVYQAFAY